MSGFTGGGGGGGGGGGACATLVVAGYFQVPTQAEVDLRTAIGTSGCPLAITPDTLRLKVVAIGSGIQLLNQVGAVPSDAGPRAIDWQAWRTAAGQAATAYYSTAVGQSNSALGVQTVAVGYANTVNNVGAPIVPPPFFVASNAGAFGISNTITGYRSFAVGFSNSILGDDNVAVGQSITMANIGPTPVINSVAIGNGATVGADGAVAIGNVATVSPSAINGIAIGNGATVSSADNGTVVGAGASATGTRATALGDQANVTGHNATALGTRSVARIDRTNVITAPNIIRKDNGEVLADADLFFAGHDFLILTPEVDFQAAAADYPISLPAGCSLWINEVGVILTTLDIPGNVAVQPTVRFGTSGTPAKWMAPVICTLLDVLRNRERFNLLLTDDGETSMSFGVTVPGSLTVPGTYLGRAYFKGMLVEDE